MIEDFFRIGELDPKTVGNPFQVSFETNMNTEDVVISTVAETDPENEITVLGSNITSERINVLTRPFTPDFDVHFTMTATSSLSGDVLDRKEFDFVAGQTNGITRKSESTLISEWSKKMNI